MAREYVKIVKQSAPFGGAYFAAMIGAAVYFEQQNSHGFLGFFWALFQAAVWPAFLLYRALVLMSA